MHHTANAQVVFVRTVSAIVHAVTTLVHWNAVFVVARETVVECTTHIGAEFGRFVGAIAAIVFAITNFGVENA
jgi:hypothetical protein